jgi:DDE superfamily endonuclease
MLKKENKSVAEIARTLGRSVTSVKSCLKRLELAADAAYLERPNCRRRRIIDERIKRRVLREIKTDASLRRLSKRYIAKEISSNIPKAFPATLVRTLKENGFPERNRRKRLKWARDHKDFKGDWWRILWTDESSVSTDSYGEVRVWCQKDELYSPECTQATMKSGRKSTVKERTTSFTALRILMAESTEISFSTLSILRSSCLKNVIFQEDNAPIHKCKIVSQLMQELGIETLEWPPQLPDLSPIENVWREVKRWIHQNRKPQTERELLEAVEYA